MSARLSLLRSQYLPFISKHRPVGSPAMIFIGPIPASSHPYFSITYTLFSIHNFAYTFYFLIAAHSLRKTPGVGSPVINFFVVLQHPSNLSPARPFPSKSHGIYLLHSYTGVGLRGLFHQSGAHKPSTHLAAGLLRTRLAPLDQRGGLFGGFFDQETHFGVRGFHGHGESVAAQGFRRGGSNRGIHDARHVGGELFCFAGLFGNLKK